MSQCSERVKHALSPPFVSSGLFSSPAPVAGGGRALRLFATRAGEQGATAGQGRFWAETASRAASASHRLPNPHGPAHRMQACGENRQYLCGYIDIIYSARRSPVNGLPAPAPDQQLMGFRNLPRPLFGHPSRLRSAKAPGDHQKRTNWSQIMHESPQSACFTGLHCNACIGDILLCLFLF